MDNSRYRKLDDGAPLDNRPRMNTQNPMRGNQNTIRTNAGPSYYDNSGMDIMEADAHQKSMQVKRASAVRNHNGRASAHNKKQTILYSVIIIIEVVILAAIWVTYAFVGSGSSSKKSSKAESSAESAQSNSVNVNNENFQATCTTVSITTDSNGNPAAVVYFTFVNKTANPLSMSEVFALNVSQSGANLSQTTDLANTPQEISNASTQISSGDSIDCAFAYTLQDSTSELTLTMHDNYETFSDIGSTVVPIS